jgi:hypothetical protein
MPCSPTCITVSQARSGDQCEHTQWLKPERVSAQSKKQTRAADDRGNAPPPQPYCLVRSFARLLPGGHRRGGIPCRLAVGGSQHAAGSVCSTPLHEACHGGQWL